MFNVNASLMLKLYILWAYNKLSNCSLKAAFCSFQLCMSDV